ncbi:MAG: pirin family protein [Patescibacteria group bacterium]
MNVTFFPESERGKGEYGWLHTRYSFSFSRYYNPERMGFGALLVLNDDIIDGGGGFPTHSHRDMEIITIPFEGQLQHRDSTGGEGTITAGEVQVMSAGTGVAHSEFNASQVEHVSLFQIWIISEQEGVQPRYDQAKFNLEDFKNNFKLMVGPITKPDLSVLQIHQQAYLSRGQFNADQEVEYKLYDPNNCLYIMQIEGVSLIAGKTLNRRDAIGLQGVGADTITLQIKGNADILLIEVPDL